MIHSALGLCLSAGPRDKVIVEKALDVMLQVPVLKYLDLCIQRFIQNRWLSNKKKLKALTGDRTSRGSLSLETIPEDLDTSNMMSQDRSCTSLIIEWAHQRLPLPMHWFLIPIATFCDSKHAGLEAMSTLLSADVALLVKNVLIIWKLHSLSIILLIGMVVLEENKSMDVYESLQELYRQLLDETRSNGIPETISNMSINLVPKNCKEI
ncbi:hypothetical protein REPUB_Repub04eG0035300 [Reevesia pubescens]